MNFISIIISQKKSNLITFLNPYSYLIARRNKKNFTNFNIKIDGILLVNIFNLFGIKFKRESFDMTSLAPVVFNKLILKDKSIYFIGTKPDLINLSVKNIKKKFPNLKIIGYRDGYFNCEERTKILNEIYLINPDCVVCGMGTPLQEDFLIDLQKNGL